MAHVQPGAPIVLAWDNLNRHICPEMRRFIADNGDGLRVFRLPSDAPDLNPVEGIWSLLNRGGPANLAAAGLDHLVRVIEEIPSRDPPPLPK
ncbi:transposase [Streptosporangium sp. NPDC006007]|uniref:transposase n=1 Tax=Streptosporangium sp. NPDC006007 TaxID=3154575 RepID=UPI0033B62462